MLSLSVLPSHVFPAGAKATNLQIFMTSSEIMIWNRIVQTNLSCSAIIYFSKQLGKYLLNCGSTIVSLCFTFYAVSKGVQLQRFTLSCLVAALRPLPPTSSFSSALNKNGYIRSDSVPRSSSVCGQSDILQEFYTFNLHLLIPRMEVIYHVEG